MNTGTMSTNSFTITEGRAIDLVEISKIWKQVIETHAEFDITFTLDKEGISNFQLMIAKALTDPQQVLYVARKGTEIIGFLYGFTKKYYGIFQTRLTAHVSDLAIKKEYRRNKIGSILMATFEKEFAKSQNVDDISLNVHIQNQQGLTFYDKLGYEKSLVTMRKRLRND
ncbi:MAG: GNAT family N-acetyltransferase [Candidatus Heimdallarchaeota archaeon]|nr:GNAT family N-acetyltransferase [Candidatus Heimdallarchaeota archaeon]